MLISYNPNTRWVPQWLGHMAITGSTLPVCYYTAKVLTPRYLYVRKVGSFIGYILFFAFMN
ncbi:hypothetical protein, partial [uncultured Mucilaginibacter sp.]|uniref:hypothetical protein n=1 Tax=uncultured Mucilaginibacter sp. TaxID=797541 RepID=UPI0025EEBE48